MLEAMLWTDVLYTVAVVYSCWHSLIFLPHGSATAHSRSGPHARPRRARPYANRTVSPVHFHAVTTQGNQLFVDFRFQSSKVGSSRILDRPSARAPSFLVLCNFTKTRMVPFVRKKGARSIDPVLVMRQDLQSTVQFLLS